MVEMMKTAVFTAPGQIELRECPVPSVGDGQILVKVDACAICTWEQRVYTGVKEVEFPFIGGHEIAGHIVDLGAGVDRREWAVGDRVAVGVLLACGSCHYCKTGESQNCEHFNHSKHLPGLPEKGMGGLSEYLVMSPNNVFRYDNIPAEQAALTEPLSCVLHSVETADIQFGDMVVVVGCGVMGLLHTMLAVKRGGFVVACDVDESRLALARELGAAYTINSAQEDLPARVAELSRGLGAQVVFNTTPIASVAQSVIDLAAQNGRVIFYSSFYPDLPVSFSADRLHKRATRIIGSANSNERDFQRTVRALTEGVISVAPLVSEVFCFDDIQAAFESAIKGGKFRVVVKM